MNSTDARSLAAKAHELRRAFDETFAQPPPPPPPATRAFLLVRAAGELLALQRDRLAGISLSHHVAPAPGGDRAFLGLVEAHHTYHPVWSLAGLLGRDVPPLGPSVWLVLAETTTGVRCAFACDAVEQMIFVTESEIIAPTRAGERALAKTAGGLAPIVEVPALHAEILKRKASKPSRSTP